MLSLHLEKFFFAVQTRLGGQGKHRYCVGVVESMTPIQKYTISPNFFLFHTSHVLSSFWKCTYMLLFSIVHGIHYDDVMYIQKRCGFWGKKNFNCAGHVSFLVGRAIIKDEHVFFTWVPFGHLYFKYIPLPILICCPIHPSFVVACVILYCRSRIFFFLPLS